MFQRKIERTYTNGVITVYWSASHCIHSGECFTMLRPVFNPQRRPWIDPNAASTRKIISVIEACPTKALMFRWNDAELNQNESSTKLYIPDASSVEGSTDGESVEELSLTKVVIHRGGPIVIENNFQLLDDEENREPTVENRVISLCRCGKSRNKYLCDSSHTHYIIEE